MISECFWDDFRIMLECFWHDFGMFFLLCFSIFNYQAISEWALVEILINYQGGFVRRGLLGEINFINKVFN